MATIHSRTDQHSMLTRLQWVLYRNTDSGRWCNDVFTATHFLLQTLTSLLADVTLQEWIYFLWSYPWTKANETFPASILVLKPRFWHCTEAIPKFLLQHIMASFPSQMQQCRHCDGILLKKIIFKCWWLQIILHWVRNVVYTHICYETAHILSLFPIF
jgi:hypothetical protein